MSSDSEFAKYSNDTDGMMKLLLDLSNKNQTDLKKQLQDTTKEIEEKFSLQIKNTIKGIKSDTENAIKEIKSDTSLQIENAARNIILDINKNIIKAQESTLAFMRELDKENRSNVMTNCAIARKDLKDVEASLNRKINTVNNNLKVMIAEEEVRSLAAESKIYDLSGKRFEDIEASWSKHTDVPSVVLDSIEDF